MGVDLKPVNIGGKDFVSAPFKGVDRFNAVKFELGKPEIPVVRVVVDGEVSVESLGVTVAGLAGPLRPIKPGHLYGAHWCTN